MRGHLYALPSCRPQCLPPLRPTRHMGIIVYSQATRFYLVVLFLITQLLTAFHPSPWSVSSPVKCVIKNTLKKNSMDINSEDHRYPWLDHEDRNRALYLITCIWGVLVSCLLSLENPVSSVLCAGYMRGPPLGNALVHYFYSLPSTSLLILATNDPVGILFSHNDVN